MLRGIDHNCAEALDRNDRIAFWQGRICAREGFSR
jgi:hypothetical protein